MSFHPSRQFTWLFNNIIHQNQTKNIQFHETGWHLQNQFPNYRCCPCLAQQPLKIQLFSRPGTATLEIPDSFLGSGHPDYISVSFKRVPRSKPLCSAVPLNRSFFTFNMQQERSTTNTTTKYYLMLYVMKLPTQQNAVRSSAR